MHVYFSGLREHVVKLETRRVLHTTQDQLSNAIRATAFKHVQIAATRNERNTIFTNIETTTIRATEGAKNGTIK
jgi:hypothetical protein